MRIMCSSAYINTAQLELFNYYNNYQRLKQLLRDNAVSVYTIYKENQLKR